MLRITVDSAITITYEPNDYEDLSLIGHFQEKLTFDNPEYAKKQRMGFWAGNTPKKLYLYEMNGNSITIPYGCITDEALRPHISSMVLLYKPNATNIDVVDTVPLYDYQNEAVSEICKHHICGILQAPPGAGKTQMGISLIARKGKKALWLTHTIDLLEQSYERAKKYLPEEKLGKIVNGKVQIGEWITFATVQTMTNLDLYKYKYEFGTIVVDECHRVAGTPSKLTQFYKVLTTLSSPYKFGLSATVHRSDGLIGCCLATLGEIIYSIDKQKVADKTIQVGYAPVYTDFKLTYDDYNPDGTFSFTKMLNSLSSNQERNKFIADMVKDDENSYLILCDRLVQLDGIYNELPDSIKEKAVIISSKTKKIHREEYLELMRNGYKRVMLATYSLAKEGLDIPRLNRLILASPHKDYAVITQAIGRIARKHDSKTDAHVYDVIDNIQYCHRAYIQRKRIYKKSDCYEVNYYE